MGRSALWVGRWAGERPGGLNVVRQLLTPGVSELGRARGGDGQK